MVAVPHVNTSTQAAFGAGRGFRDRFLVSIRKLAKQNNIFLYRMESVARFSDDQRHKK
jgi:hypothetical protein